MTKRTGYVLFLSVTSAIMMFMFYCFFKAAWSSGELQSAWATTGGILIIPAGAMGLFSAWIIDEGWDKLPPRSARLARDDRKKLKSERSRIELERRIKDLEKEHLV